jgi:hypothetical protein
MGIAMRLQKPRASMMVHHATDCLKSMLLQLGPYPMMPPA